MPDEPIRIARREPAEIPEPTREPLAPLDAPTTAPPTLATNEPPVPNATPAPEVSVPMETAAAVASPDELPPAEDPVAAPAVLDDLPPLRIRPDAPALAIPARTANLEPPPALAPPSRSDAPPPIAEPIASAPIDRPSPAPDEVGAPLPEPAKLAAAPPGDDLRARSRPGSSSLMNRVRPELEPITIAHADPKPSERSPIPAPPNRPVIDVPEVYRERIDPDRSARAKLQGATQASERSVELALDWLARHQDADGRWNAGTRQVRGDDDRIASDASFTQHCPPGEICVGECFYAEADTAMTGLALLAYLGAGYTHVPADAKHAATVRKGLQFLLKTQKSDGDLRGESRAVGLYCHAMAALALCEAYALTGDQRLRDPAARAVEFLAKSRADDGLSWRYKPGDPSGDTSLLGWAILVFKTADEVDLIDPAAMRAGALGWLNLVKAGKEGGLAVYRPNEGPHGGADKYVPGRNMTPTMTAEAWVCRQFLGVGGPSAASDEAAEYLMRNRPERSKLNLYYWYYGTLAIHRRGGADWDEWNRQVRDALVALQALSGHQAGSWNPTDSRSNYDVLGGRIYCTALAAMTLEVYYRYGNPDAKPPRMAPRGDPGVRRSKAEAEARKP